MIQKFIIVNLALSAIFLVISCSLPKETAVGRIIPPLTFSGHESDALSSGRINWRTYFNDPFLAKLIDTALVRNFDLKMALQQIEIANALHKISKGASVPTLQAEGSTFFSNIKNDENKSNSQYSVGLRSSWEIDLWGKMMNSRKAAGARLLADQYGKQLVQTILISDLAKAYFELLAFDAELQIIEKNIRLQSAALDIVKVQKQAGKATDLAVQQFEAQLLNTQAQRSEFERMITTSESYINLLLNRMPQSVERSNSFTSKQLLDSLRVGVPVNLLENRPDIIEASLLLEAKGYDVKSARRAFYPSLKIEPYWGLGSSQPKTLFNSASQVLEITNGLVQPLLQQRTLKGALKIREAEQKQAFYNYEKVLIKSITEVQESLDKLSIIEQELRVKKKEVEVLIKAINAANDLYAYGYANYLEVINAQKNARESEIALITTQKEQYLILINLYRALGGGR